MLFTSYIQSVGGLRIVYGSIVTIIATLLWFYLSSLVLLFAAHLDAARYRVRSGVFVPVHPVSEPSDLVSSDLSDPPTSAASTQKRKA